MINTIVVFPIHSLHAQDSHAQSNLDNVEVQKSTDNKKIEVSFVPNLSKADEFAKHIENQVLAEYQEHHGETIVIEVIHFGELKTLPKELEWLVNYLKHLETNPKLNVKLKVKLKLVSKNKLAKSIKRTESFLNSKLSEELGPIAYELKYFDDPAKNSNPKGFKNKIKEITSTLGVSAKKYFGLPQGTNWIMYKHSFTKRTNHEKLIEFRNAAIQASALFGITSYALMQKAAESPELLLAPMTAAFTAAMWKLLTGYIQRANNSFFVQGIEWNPIKKFRINRHFFLMSQYVHSIIIAGTVQLAARGPSAMMDADILLHTIWNSFLGLFAKALPTLLIAKHQQKQNQVNDSESRNHSKWKTIRYNFAFDLSYQTLKVIHLFEFNFLNLSYVFVGLGITGAVYEVYNYFKPVKKSKYSKKTGLNSLGIYKWNKMKEHWGDTGNAQRNQCRTLFKIFSLEKR